jgi:membrane protease subunit (stomatin/prohibitin family)
MGIWDGIKHQFIEVIEWTEPSDDILAFRFPVANHEIKNGAELTVRESQVALLVDQGQTADLFAPGLHTLSTENLPILTKLESWSTGFNSPFKSEVYFFSLRQKLGQKWGTRQPITVRDAEFGSVQLRMFGVHSYHLSDAPKFYREVSGTREKFTTEDLADQLLATIVSTAATTFAQSKVPFLDLAANLQTLSATLRAALAPPFAALGLALDSFVVESVSLPSALEQALQTRQAIGIVGNLQTYAQYQAAKSIPDAAQNPSGLAGLGAGVAVGAGIGQVMGQALGGVAAPQPSAASGPPQPSAAGADRAPPSATAAELVDCVACGKGIEPGSGFCRFCGQVQKLVCPGCQKVVASGSAFCPSCGRKLGA